MSADATARVRELAAELARLSERLRDPEIADADAAELARQAAELVSQAGNEIDRAVSESGSDGD